MKKYTSHILIAFMVLIASAPFLLPGTLVLQKALIVHEIREKMEHEQLLEIRTEIAHIRWIEKGKELWLGNRMFDVKEMREEGKYLVLKGLYDDEEKEIYAKMRSLSAPIPFEKERSSTIYQLTHLETSLQSSSDLTPEIYLSAFFISPSSSILAGAAPTLFAPPDTL